jgi:hypothetical protein
MWEILCRERDLPRKSRKIEKNQETKNAEINNIDYMELYSGAKMVSEKDLKTKYLRSKNREFTVLAMQGLCSTEMSFILPVTCYLQR